MILLHIYAIFTANNNYFLEYNALNQHPVPGLYYVYPGTAYTLINPQPGILMIPATNSLMYPEAYPTQACEFDQPAVAKNSEKNDKPYDLKPSYNQFVPTNQNYFPSDNNLTTKEQSEVINMNIEKKAQISINKHNQQFSNQNLPSNNTWEANSSNSYNVDSISQKLKKELHFSASVVEDGETLEMNEYLENENREKNEKYHFKTKKFGSNYKFKRFYTL